jgi:hypothetical protein
MAEVYNFSELMDPVEKIALHSITTVLKGEVRGNTFFLLKTFI